MYSFGEKKEELGLPVWKSPKYEQSKAKAIEMIESQKYGLDEADFWILMNKAKKGDKMIYSGLIISHNGCLKINDHLEENERFKEEYCSSPIQIGEVWVMEYRDKRNGLYEIGEISKTNCTNQYPFAMLLKRTFDRAVLKISKLAFYGVYSDSESEEFNNNSAIKEDKQKVEMISDKTWKELNQAYSKEEIKEFYKELNITNGKNMTEEYAKGKLNEYLEKLKKEKLTTDKEFY